MKIALLSEKYTPDIGGLAISTGRLGHLLASAGHDLRVFAPSSNLPPFEKRILPHSGISVTRFGAHKRVDDTLVNWLELIVEEHKREPFDLLHAYFITQAGFVATYAGKYLNIPSVISIRGNDIERAAFDPSRFSHMMYALQNANAVTTNARELLNKAKAFVNREIVLIPNGIDTRLFRKLERNNELADSLGLNQHIGNISERSAVIGFVGELREKKGLATVLSGYAKINKVEPSALLIVGEIRTGEDRRIFDEFLFANPNSRVVVTGYIPHKDLPAYYSLIDVFVHLSLRDGMPNAILEAMACEKAIIATSVGGVSDVIQHGVNGMIIPVNDANLAARVINELLANPGLREQLGRSAREKIETEYSYQRELAGNLEVYQQLK